MIFEKKKIQIETLSEYLTQVRTDLNLSQDDVVSRTSIQPKFLMALENGNFKILPADVYVFGFLKQLSILYIINSEILIDQYKKERGIHAKVNEERKYAASNWYNKRFKKLIITPKILSLSFGLAFVVLSVGYIIWQVWSINRTPSLEVFEPANNSAILGSAVKIKGRTDIGMSIDVNGQGIFVDNKGNFETQLGLNPGPEQIVVTAKNRFDKSAVQNISVIGQATTSVVSSNHLQLKVDFSAQVTFVFSIDGQPQQTFNFNSGDSKTFSANQKILISTTDAGATKVTVNGQSLGSMGRSKEVINDVPFFAQPDEVKK
jgi:cytoskeletal protein RodZ